MNNNLKRFLGYFLYMVFIGFVLYWAGVYEHYLKELVRKTYETRIMLHYRVSFPVILGVLLALPRFISTARNPGQWCIDWVKLLAVSLPFLYAVFFVLTYFSPLGSLFPGWLMRPGRELFSISPIPITVFGIIFGYTLLSAVKKKD